MSEAYNTKELTGAHPSADDSNITLTKNEKIKNKITSVIQMLVSYHHD